MQKRLQGLLRDTWWLWLVFAVIAIVMSFKSVLFLVTFPILTVAFCYYAIMRYDDEGKHKGEPEH